MRRLFAHPRFTSLHYRFHTWVEPYLPHSLMDVMTSAYEKLGGREWFITATDGIKMWHGSKRSADEETARVNPKALRRKYGQKR